MAYVINKFNGVQLVVLDDGTIDTTTSLGLVGRNYVGYGETQNENFVFLLENFANDAPPSRPLQGQIWFNTTTNLTYAYDGVNWNPIGAAVLSATAPTDANAGALWLDTTANQLKIYTGSAWTFIGPEAVPGFGVTRARATSLDDSVGDPRPVIILETNGTALAICTAQAFTINPANAVAGFENNLIAGINLSTTAKVKGDITGNAGSADRLSTARTINGTPFDGQQNVTIKSSTTNKLVRGTYIFGSDFDGSLETTWSVDATPSNVVGKLVARNSEGGFSAGTISANFVGNVTGNVTASSGTSTFNVVQANTFVGATLTGNANSATQLATPRQINGVNFNGTSDITVPAAADTLTGNTLNSTVTQSSLAQVGTLVSLNVADSGVYIGSSGQLRMFVDSGRPTVRSSTGTLNFDTGPSGPDVSFVDSATALSLGGPNAPAILGDNTTNLGITGYKFNNVYANNFLGNSDTATLATTATNIAGGGAGAIPFQTAAGTTSMLGLGTAGYVLTAQAGSITWSSISREPLRRGSFLTLINTNTSGAVASYDGIIDATIAVDATSANTVSKVVARDSSGNFAAGTITANLTGNVSGTVSGNAGSATQLQTARNINGVAFNGTQDITITATDNTKVALAGSTMTGYLTLNGNPVNALHATPKQYVDSRLPQYTFTYGNTIYSTAGFTNQVGSWNNGANFFDVFPPSGKSMGNLIAFIPSIAVIHYAGGVNGDDSMRCTWSNLGDRIRVYVQNTEQRSTPAANYMAIWS
jgi:hypothetical protein